MRPTNAPIVLVLVGLLAQIGAGTAPAVELRDGELIAGGSPVLQNGTGTVRLEDARLGRVGAPVFVPEPGFLLQLGSGVGLLVLLTRRRGHDIHADTNSPAQPDRADSATPRRRNP